MTELALAAYLALFSADAVTTHVALSQGAYELYLSQSPAVNDLIIAGQAGLLYWSTSKIKRPAIRWTIRLSIASLHGYAAVHNARQLHKLH